jgi:hypothetical protein
MIVICCLELEVLLGVEVGLRYVSLLLLVSLALPRLYISRLRWPLEPLDDAVYPRKQSYSEQ